MSSKSVTADDGQNDEIDYGRIPVWNKISFKLRKKLIHYLLNLVTAVSMFFIIFPMFWVASTAFRPTKEANVIPVPLLPQTWTLEQFHIVFFETSFITYYINSFKLTFGVVLLTTVTSTLGGYGLTRLDIPRKRTFARIILFGYMFPSILLAIPMFIFWRELGLLDSAFGLIFAVTAGALPFSLWLMWKFFQTVPVSLEESARMAGASRFRAFLEIALPMAKPGIVAVAIFSYAIAWNAYTIPKIIIRQREDYPLTVGIDSFVQGNAIQFPQLMAASFLIILPSLIFVYFLQHYLLSGFRPGGA